MKLDRRQLLATGSAWLAACSARVASSNDPQPALNPKSTSLEEVFAANSVVLPESSGGANHYPMAAEAIDALGRADAMNVSWRDRAAAYAGPAGRTSPLANEGEALQALGTYDARLGDWIDFFRAELGQQDWQTVVARWASQLAPGISAATFHGVIRTGHAVRALRHRSTPARRDELAVALAYWAGRYVELPNDGRQRGSKTYEEVLVELDFPWADDGPEADFGFHDVLTRLREQPIAPAVEVRRHEVSARDDLTEIVRASAVALIEQLPRERHAIWLMHTVTGPAAVELLLPEVGDTTARQLNAYAWQATAGLFNAYGAPFEPRAHLGSAPEWPQLIDLAVELGYVHGLKLTEALRRFDRDGDPAWRAAAAAWLAT